MGRSYWVLVGRTQYYPCYDVQKTHKRELFDFKSQYYQSWKTLLKTGLASAGFSQAHICIWGLLMGLPGGLGERWLVLNGLHSCTWWFLFSLRNRWLGSTSFFFQYLVHLPHMIMVSEFPRAVKEDRSQCSSRFQIPASVMLAVFLLVDELHEGKNKLTTTLQLSCMISYTGCELQMGHCLWTERYYLMLDLCKLSRELYP
jgi:hypothetical protein